MAIIIKGVYNKSYTVLDGIANSTDKALFSKYDGIRIASTGETYMFLTYTITTTLVNVTANSTDVTTIRPNGTVSLAFTANSGYNLPNNVTVTGATLNSWNNSTGILVISNPVSDVSISITAEEAEPLSASTLSVTFNSQEFWSDSQTSTVTLSGGTGSYTATVSSELASFTNGYASSNTNYVAASVTASIKESTLTITCTITSTGAAASTDGSISGSGTVTVMSGDETLAISVTVSRSWTCLTGDMLITMVDGSQKRIDTLTIGEEVLSVDPITHELVPDTIVYSDSTMNKTHNWYDIWYFSNGTQVKTVHRHRLYNVESQAMVNMDEWTLGEHAYCIDGSITELVGHEHVIELVKHYTIFTKSNQMYFVNGLLSGNKYSTELEIGSVK